jgi:hypothetical protein
VAPNKFDHLQAVDVRHIQIENHEADGSEGEPLNCLESVIRFVEFDVLQFSEGCDYHPPNRRRIVHDQYSLHQMATYFGKKICSKLTDYMFIKQANSGNEAGAPS